MEIKNQKLVKIKKILFFPFKSKTVKFLLVKCRWYLNGKLLKTGASLATLQNLNSNDRALTVKKIN